jgi:uncharacterized RDD family membrane protein YckC
MNPSETQPDFVPPSIYIDPESSYSNEQEFPASLEKPVGRPQFVLDARASGTEDGAVEGRGAMLRSDSGGRQATAWGAGSGAAKSGNDGEEQDAGSSYIGTEAGEADWREQVSAKVNRYKSRKPRPERYPSLQLKFEAVRQSPERPDFDCLEPEAPNATVSFIRPLAAIAEDPMQARTRDPEPQFLVKASLEATARVLEFPRFGALPVRRDDQLADPVVDRPRIVEAPELLPPPPAMGGILIEETHDQEHERRPGFDMPLQSATLSRRSLAGALDALVIFVALAGFGYIFFRITGSAPELRSLRQFRFAASLIAGFVGGLWFMYQYAFLVFSGTTPGLRLTRLAVAGFDGVPASRKLRRWRVLASLLSCLSLGLGYVWCFMDEDQLSWHDRITKTHVAPINRLSSRP